MAVRDEGYRAPLLWLLIPYTVGLVLPAEPLRTHAAGALTAALVLAIAGVIASRTRPRAAFVAWALCVTVSGVLLGIVRVHSATGEPVRWRDLPPREARAEVEILRVFPPTQRKPAASALGRIVRAPELLADLGGSRVYLTPVALEGGHAPIPSQMIAVTGVLESVHFDPRTIGRKPGLPSAESFREFLLANAVYFKMTRCRVEGTIAAPSAWHGWWAALGRRFDVILSAGLAKESPATGAYLAMFLGRKDTLTAEQKLDYLQTGAMHLFAISGLHIAAIAACLHGMLRVLRLPELLRAVVGIAVLVAFVEATGGTPSARRALVMVAIVWIGKSIRRPANPIASIATAAFAVLVCDPLAFRSISFQFSYSVVAMLLLYGAPLTNRWLARWQPWAHIPDQEWRWWHRATFFGGRRVIVLASTSWTAALISTPLTVAYFGIATPGAILANLVLVPVSLYTITAGFASLVCGLCGATWLSVVFNHAAAMILVAMNAFAGFAADWPGMFFEGHFASAWMAPALVAGTLVLCLVGYGLRWSRVPGGLALPPVVLILALVFLVTAPPPDRHSGTMKSAYELALERMGRSDPESSSPLTPEQKEQLAEIGRVYQGRIAEREIFLKQRLSEVESRGELEEAAKIRRELASERARLEEACEAEKEKVRRVTRART